MTDLGFAPALCVLPAAGFIWLMTTLGSAVVFFFKSFDRRLHALILGSTAGIMTAASFWSLLEPSIELSVSRGGAGWTAASAGIAAGTLFLAAADALTERLRGERGSLLMLSVTIHNIPEGLAVGVAFGLAGSAAAFPAAAAAWSVALGIGIQNFPEGAAISLPMRRSGASRAKSFLMGTLSGAVEPAAALVGAALVSAGAALLPWALSFAAGAMLYVAAGELIPQAAQLDKNKAVWSFAAGFTLMMILDVALG